MSRIEQIQEFLQDTPNDPFLHYALTMEYVKLGDVTAIRNGFEKMLSQFPDYVGIYYHFGKFLESQQEKQQAEEVYKKGIEVATSVRNMHAKGELMGALNMLLGFDDDDDDY